MALANKPVIGVLGAGAMGSGIAQVAATRGHRVVLADAQSGAGDVARERIATSLTRDVEKARLTREDGDAALEHLTIAHVASTTSYEAFATCDLVIEAIVEQLDAKRTAMQNLERVVRRECVLATNTSSLSIAAIGAACEHPDRTLGIHFFNPATVMPLVEIVPGVRTDPAHTTWARGVIDSWGKTTVLALDTPGFIVNRVARPYYGEALRILDEGLAAASDIDWAMTALGGFRMGPFELMDFIGHDINYIVTESVWTALYY
ncbi:MAG: 3-hydroxyacyl-CoA dehydrogenase NAD-binding domain-containing protein, partial [Gemmatimonadaceae bacterium]